MKTKRKEKEQKKNKRKEARRKWFCPESNSGPSTHRTISFTGHVEHTTATFGNFIIKTLSLIKREFKYIFQKNDCSLDSENPK